MSRVAFSRDELLQALQVITQFLQAIPDGEYVPSNTRRLLPLDGSSPGAATTLPADGSTVAYGFGKGQPQPPRKCYTLFPKLKLERIDWKGLKLPRVAQQITTVLSGAAHPLTAHEITQPLGIANSTFHNAMSKLQRHKIVMTVPARDVIGGNSSSRRVVDSR